MEIEEASSENRTKESIPDDPVVANQEFPADTKPEKSPSRSSNGSPEPNCAICLGKFENKSFTDSCFHQFCFTCLLEWSKVKAECPLCKQSFKSIIHNVRSIEDYDQYHLRRDEIDSWEMPNGRRFHYRSTLTPERRRELALNRLLFSHRIGQAATRHFTRSQHRPITSEFRRYIYNNRLYVSHPDGGRVVRSRNTTPSFYRNNPACTHRLVPWLNRELNVLLYNHETHVSFVLELVMSLIHRYEINGPEFREHIQPYILMNTDHFIHEFYQFASSPWDMIAYDERAEYGRSRPRDDASSPDSEIVFLMENRATGANVETLLISSSSSDSSRNSRIADTVFPTSELAGGVLPELRNPEPPTMSQSLIDRVKNFLQHVDTERNNWSSATSWDSTAPVASSSFSEASEAAGRVSSPVPGPSGINVNVVPSNSGEDSDNSSVISSFSSKNSTRSAFSVVSTIVTTPAKQEVPRAYDDNDTNDCVIVGYVKPLEERTPEIIEINDSSSDDRKLHINEQKNETNETRKQKSKRKKRKHSHHREHKSNSSKHRRSNSHSSTRSSHSRTKAKSSKRNHHHHHHEYERNQEYNQEYFNNNNNINNNNNNEAFPKFKSWYGQNLDFDFARYYSGNENYTMNSIPGSSSGNEHKREYRSSYTHHSYVNNIQTTESQRHSRHSRERRKRHSSSDHKYN